MRWKNKYKNPTAPFVKTKRRRRIVPARYWSKTQSFSRFYVGFFGCGPGENSTGPPSRERRLSVMYCSPPVHGILLGVRLPRDGSLSFDITMRRSILIPINRLWERRKKKKRIFVIAYMDRKRSSRRDFHLCHHVAERAFSSPPISKTHEHDSARQIIV